MKIAGQTIAEYFESRGMMISIGHPDNSSLAAWVRHPEGGCNLAFGWLNNKLPSRRWLVRLQRIAVVKHARRTKEAEHIAWLHQVSKEIEVMHTVPKPRLNVRRVRRIAAPISQ